MSWDSNLSKRKVYKNVVATSVKIFLFTILKYSKQLLAYLSKTVLVYLYILLFFHLKKHDIS